MREVLIDLARMHRAARPHEVQNVGRLAPRLGAPGLARLARMHQGQVLARQETVVDQAVLIDRQARVAAFQIAGAVVLDAVAQRQVLRPRRGADRIGLHEAQAADRRRQRGRGEQAAGDGVAAQVFEAGVHGQIPPLTSRMAPLA